MNAVEKHPQRQEIIEAILAGESLRSIAKRAVPPVNHVTLSRFKLKMIVPAIQNMRGTSLKYQGIRDFAQTTSFAGDPNAGADSVSAALKQRIQETVDARLERRSRWISNAENRPILDPETGEVVGNSMDHKALAAHDRNEGSDLEFLSRLGGLLQDGAAGATNVQIAVMVPGAEMPEMACVEIGKTR